MTKTLDRVGNPLTEGDLVAIDISTLSSVLIGIVTSVKEPSILTVGGQRGGDKPHINPGKIYVSCEFVFQPGLNMLNLLKLTVPPGLSIKKTEGNA